METVPIWSLDPEWHTTGMFPCVLDIVKDSLLWHLKSSDLETGEILSVFVCALSHSVMSDSVQPPGL